MVFVLLVIYLFSTASTSMESEDERVAIRGFGSQSLILKFYGFVFERDGPLLDHEEVEFSLILLELNPFF